MKKETASAIVLTLLILAGTSVAAFKIHETIFSAASSAKGSPDNPWLVGPVPPYDFSSIQQAVYNGTVTSGDTIAVYFNGSVLYNESVYVNKTLTIEHWSYDDGSYPNVKGFIVAAAGVNISGFIVQQDIYLNSSNNVVSNNTAGSISIALGSFNNTLTQNNLSYFKIEHPNLYSQWNESAVEHFVQNIDESNTVNGQPIFYWVNQHNRTIPGLHAGYIAIVDSTNVSAENLSLQSSYQGVLVVNSSDVDVANVSLTHHYEGILVANSSGITVEDLNLQPPYTSLSDYGVVFNDVTDSNIENGKIDLDVAGTWAAILLSYSRNNTVRDNVGSSSTGNFVCGIELYNSDGNFIADNNIKDTTPKMNGPVGMYLESSLNNTVVANSISGTTWGLVLASSNWNMFYHNNFMQLYRNQTVSVTNSINNSFDNGYEGNYWSDYTGNDPHGHGIGDSRYQYPYPPSTPDITDYHPLMQAWSENGMYERPMEIRPSNDIYVQKMYTISNCTLGLQQNLPSTAAGFTFNGRPLPTITLNATCGYDGFLNIVIPRNWTDEPFNVSVDNVTKSDYLFAVNSTFSSIYMTFNSSGTHTVEIIGLKLGSIAGDLNGDGVVNILDAIILGSNFLAKEPGAPFPLP